MSFKSLSDNQDLHLYLLVSFYINSTDLCFDEYFAQNEKPEAVFYFEIMPFGWATTDTSLLEMRIN